MYTIVNNYLTDPKNKELEIRFKFQPSVGLNLYKKIIEQADEEEISRSITLISQNKRKEIFFDYSKNPVTKTEKYLEKTPGSFYFGEQKKYKLSESSEIEIEPFNTNNSNLLRLKYRSSIHIEDHDFRYDFTITRELDKSEMQSIGKYKKLIFDDQTSEVFFENAQKLLELPLVNLEFEAEYIAKSLNANEILKSIRNCIDFIDSLLYTKKEVSSVQKYIYEVASAVEKDANYVEKFKKYYGLKELVNNPVSISRENLFKIKECFATEKTDGIRGLIIVNSKNKDDSHIVILSADKEYTVPNAGRTTIHRGLTVFDCEIIEKKDTLEIKIFDALMLGGKNVTKTPFEERYESLEKSIKGLNPKIFKIKEMFDLRVIKNIKQILTDLLKIKNIDGIIFTLANSLYFDSNSVFKFKEAKDLTIDFLLKKHSSKQKMKNDKKNQSYLLFSGINNHDLNALGLDRVYNEYRQYVAEIVTANANYFPAPFAPSCAPYAFQAELDDFDLDGKICELIYEGKPPEGSWKFVKIREDKMPGLEKGVSFGNNFKVAEKTLIDLLNPITINDLLQVFQNVEVDSYFKNKASADYKKLTKVNNFVKAKLIQQFKNTNLVIDLGIGKGQDYFTYNCYGVKNLIGLDQDLIALMELSNRRYKSDSKEACVYIKHDDKPNTNMFTTFGMVDLSIKNEEIISLIDKLKYKIPDKADGVVANLMIHYLINNNDDVKKLVDLVYEMLKDNGVFVFTTFDGEKIFKMLENLKKGELWKKGRNENGDKYIIRKDYDDKDAKLFSIQKKGKLTTKESVQTKLFNLKIGVKHHFSDTFYVENLVDVNFLIESFAKKGFKLQQFGSFSDLHEQFSKFNPSIFKQLSEDDLYYSGLYTYVSLVKVSPDK